MKYLLTLQLDPALIEGMTEDEQNAAFVVGHEKFQKTLTESGEFIGTKALAFPADTVTVRVRDGVAKTSSGLFADTGSTFLCGYYLVDCASKERAIEVAALVPEAAFTGIEVREITNSAPSDRLGPPALWNRVV
jgi:hypothetical protein